MGIIVLLVRSLKSSILGLTCFQMVNALLVVANAVVEQSKSKSQPGCSGRWESGPWGWLQNPSKQKKKENKIKYEAISYLEVKITATAIEYLDCKETVHKLLTWVFPIPQTHWVHCHNIHSETQNLFLRRGSSWGVIVPLWFQDNKGQGKIWSSLTKLSRLTRIRVLKWKH